MYWHLDPLGKAGVGGAALDERIEKHPNMNSKGSGTPEEILISTPCWDYRQQKLQIVFRSLLVKA